MINSHPSVKVFPTGGVNRLSTQILCLVIFAETSEIGKLLALIADTVSLPQAGAQLEIHGFVTERITNRRSFLTSPLCMPKLISRTAVVLLKKLP